MPTPDIPLHEHLRRFARSQPDKPAYLWYGQAISYAELDAASDAFAARLAALGVRSGDPVALFLGNCPQYVMAHLGIQKLGAVVCPCGPLNKAHELNLQWRGHAPNRQSFEAAYGLSETRTCDTYMPRNAVRWGTHGRPVTGVRILDPESGAERGEVVRAFIVLKPGQTMDEAGLIAWSRDNMAGYKAPKTVRFIAALPATSAGKVLRRLLKEQN